MSLAAPGQQSREIPSRCPRQLLPRSDNQDKPQSRLWFRSLPGVILDTLTARRTIPTDRRPEAAWIASQRLPASRHLSFLSGNRENMQPHHHSHAKEAKDETQAPGRIPFKHDEANGLHGRRGAEESFVAALRPVSGPGSSSISINNRQPARRRSLPGNSPWSRRRRRARKGPTRARSSV